MQNFVRAHRHDVFLDEHLDAVGHRLKKPERPDAIWSVTILYAPKNFSLQHGNEREEREKYTEQRGDVDEAGCDLHQPVGRTCQRRKQRLFCANEDLVKKVAAHCHEGKRCSIL